MTGGLASKIPAGMGPKARSMCGAGSAQSSLWCCSDLRTLCLSLQRILEVIGLVFLVGLCGFFFALTAGRCIELPEDWWVQRWGWGDGAAWPGNAVWGRGPCWWGKLHAEHRPRSSWHRADAKLDDTYTNARRWEDKEEMKREYGVRFFCGETEHNDVATLFLSSTHHSIVKLFSMGRIDAVRSWAA